MSAKAPTSPAVSAVDVPVPRPPAVTLVVLGGTAPPPPSSHVSMTRSSESVLYVLPFDCTVPSTPASADRRTQPLRTTTLIFPSPKGRVTFEPGLMSTRH